MLSGYQAPVHTRPKKFVNKVVTLKTHQMFSIHKTQQSPDILDLCLRKYRAGKSRDYRDVIVLEKLRLSTLKRKARRRFRIPPL